jgi:tetratricopeptide (TPR) repeat protein
MAQPRADRPQISNLPDPVTVPGKALLPPAGESVNDVSSIDKLLAMTDEPWDIGEQVRSLQIAADEQPRTHADGSPASIPPAKGRGPALMLPTPFELAPAQISEASVLARRAQEFPVATPSVQPPPLPPRASKPPPSLSKGPPPLPPPRSPDQTGGARRSFPSLPDQTGSQPRRATIAESAANPASLGELLLARISALEPAEDKVGLARAHIEMAVASETVLADDARAIGHAEAALKIDPRLAAAHAILRRRKHGRAALGAMLGHLDHELSASTAEAATLELLVEKARLLDAMGDQPDSVRAVWEQALTRAPRHAASLKGLEGELTSRANQGSLEAHEALAYHLAQMADAYHAEPRLAAWLHVERAFILEWRLRKIDAARGALERAVELDASVGPVRDALVRHLAAHNDAVALVVRLDEEATIEIDPFRAARLLLDAAMIANERLRDTPQAIELLTRAARHAPTMPTVDRRVLDELVRLHEAMAEWPEAARARRARLPFFNDPEVLGYEFLALARINERLEEIDDAIADVEQALAIDPNDAFLLDMLDRLLATAGKDEQRVTMWVSEAARLEEDATKRARALGKAAHIAENTLGRPNDAIRHLRGAWIAAPGDAEVLDALARLLAPSPSERADGEARALIDLYAQAVESSRDNGRRVAYLEKIALIWEELIGDSRRAARAFEEILLLEPDRRGAVLGLARNAARTGDERALSRALLDEARLAGDGVGVLTLRTRAASALARIDPARALSLVDDVLEHDGAHPVARALETRLHEEAGRWDRAAESIRARIANASQPREKLSLYLTLAQIQDKKLRSPSDALKSLQAAHSLDPTHPVPPEEIARMLEASGDHKTLRTAIEALAKDSSSAEDRLRFLVRAAEIDELRLGDDVSAAEIYTRALRESPDDELIAERLARVLARQAATAARSMDSPESARSALAELASLQAQRIGRSPDGALARGLSFELALILIELGRDLPHAVSLLESVLAEDPAHHPSLRALETVARKTGEWASLANTLSRQGEAFQDVRARLGSLWGARGARRVAAAGGGHGEHLLSDFAARPHRSSGARSDGP